MLPNSEDINFLVGDRDFNYKIEVLEPYSEVVCYFLDELSKKIINNKEAKGYSDIISFGFWCRKSNILKLKQEYNEIRIRKGRGNVFHIAPSNVPVNFAFSYVFGLLAGNSNIVKVPTKDFKQVDIICKLLKELLEKEEYKKIKLMTKIIRYSYNNDITKEISKNTDVRIIWGGDETVREIKKNEMKERSFDVAFSDRYSICIINISEIDKCNEEEIKKLAEKFYNDTYLMDQNACSSPHLILWSGEQKKYSEVKTKFWNAVYLVAKEKYDIEPIKAIDKYNDICRLAIQYNNLNSLKKYSNLVYCIELNTLNEKIDELRGKYGLFFEYFLKDFEEISNIVNSKYQTLTYYGFSKEELEKIVLLNNLSGIDRVVPIGKALDISVFWDGYDIIRTLSRVVCIE